MPSSIVRDLDPAVERVILRCLERDPNRRPASALAVAAALPGGDPLAAALAAGETPSPDLLVAAGESEAFAVAPALTMALSFVVVLLVFAAFASRASLPGLVPMDKPRDVPHRPLGAERSSPWAINRPSPIAYPVLRRCRDISRGRGGPGLPTGGNRSRRARPRPSCSGLARVRATSSRCDLPAL